MIESKPQQQQQSCSAEWKILEKLADWWDKEKIVHTSISSDHYNRMALSQLASIVCILHREG